MGKGKRDYTYIRYYCPCGETILITANAYFRMSDEELTKYLEEHCPKHILTSFSFPSFQTSNNTIDLSKLDEYISFGWSEQHDTDNYSSDD